MIEKLIEGLTDAIGFVVGALVGYGLGETFGWEVFAEGYSTEALLAIALIGIAFAARTHRFERAVGLDRALLWPRWLGETAAILLVAHIIATLIAFAGGREIARQSGAMDADAIVRWVEAHTVRA